MGKNILIFSDGTGQVGGLKPDQRLSNIYKLYRAARVSPENNIDPDQQVAFYDAGLGTSDTDQPFWVRPISFIRRALASATGTGLGRNMVDCYAFIIENWEPGDRIYLFGFSRGGYTVRCLSNALSLCGIPSVDSTGSPLKRRGPVATKIAEEAVYRVYDHASGKASDEHRAERAELAKRFRAKYRSFDLAHPDRSNAIPYFIGAFDAVAALGLKTSHRILAISAAALLAFLVGLAVSFPAAALGRRLASLIPFDVPVLSANFNPMLWSILILVLCALILAVRWLPSHRKVINDFPTPGQARSHWLWFRMTPAESDTRLEPRVRYARHAMAIDERRALFPRAKWGGEHLKDVPENERVDFVQLWFAGNHSDIGGSYLENESRLSDIPLQWMVDEVGKLEHPVLLDMSRLNLFPRADGIQHCEVRTVKEASWLRRLIPWKEDERYTASGARHHPSVEERFGLTNISLLGEIGPYRPKALIYDPKWGPICQAGHRANLPADFNERWIAITGQKPR